MSNYLSRCAAAIAMTCALGGTPAFAADSSYAEARAHIENLIAQYFHAFDTQNADDFVATFAEDGELVLTGATIDKPLTFRGHEQLRKFIEMIRERTKMPAQGSSGTLYSPNIHFLGNLSLKVNGNNATGKAYWFTVRRGENHDLITEANPNPSYFASIGTYDEEYVRRNGKWLFKRIYIAEMQPAVTPPAK